MNGDVPFVRESEAEYLVAISDRNIMWRIPTEEIGEAFGTYSIATATSEGRALS
jgi:hypothetical protein